MHSSGVDEARNQTQERRTSSIEVQEPGLEGEGSRVVDDLEYIENILLMFHDMC